MLKQLLKNQFFIVGKKWMSFFAIFVMLILSAILVGASLSTNKNVGSLFSSLRSSVIFKYDFAFTNKDYQPYHPTNQFFADVQQYFYDSSHPLTDEQKMAITESRPITTRYHQDEIANWNYDFVAWLLNRKLTNDLGDHNYQISVRNQVVNQEVISNHNGYSFLVFSYFNDKNWKAKYNQVLLPKVIMHSGRIPQKPTEVVVTPNNNRDFQIGQQVLLNNKNYKIVGMGYDYAWYQSAIWNSTNYNFPYMYFQNSEFNRNIWLNNSFWGHKHKYINYFIQTDISTSVLRDSLGDFVRDYALKYNDLKFQDIINNMFESNPQFILASVQIEIFLYFGIMILVLSLLLTIIFIKKELGTQKSIFGVLISLGMKKNIIYLTVSIIYCGLLILPIIIGYGLSFLLQFYLTKEISNIVFIFNGFVIFAEWPLIILLVIFPIIAFLTIYILTIYFTTQPPLALLRPFKVSRYLIKNAKRQTLMKNPDLKLMFAFLRTNLSKAVGNIFIFFFVTLITFSSVVMMSSFNYSKVISNMKFRTEKIKSVFSDLTQNTDNLFNSLANNLDYDYNLALQWVTYQEFQENINKTYYQATLSDFLNNKNLYNYFLTPQQVKQYANDPNILAIIKSFNPNFATLFDLAFPIWQQYQEYPYLTFGFKLYETSNTGLYSDLTGNWEMNNLKIARSFKFEGFFNNNFDYWMYFKNMYTTDALADLKTINNNFINIILPMQMAKVLNVKMGDILPASLESNQLIGSLPWNHLSLGVVGVNYYNYSDNMVLMDPSAFYHYFFSQYQQVFPSSKITINKLTSLANGSLSTKGMEVLKNLGFYSKNQKYEDYGSYNLIGNYLSYAMNNFPQQGSMITTWEVLLNSMQLLNIFFYIIAIVILFVLVFLIFDENKHFIINLKILGYSNSKISSYFMLPYLLFFIVFLIINSFLSYFIIKALFLILFNYSATLFLITIPYVSLVLVSLGFLVILFLIYLFAYYYISRQPFMLILNE